ncbi:MAG: hypothetical protein E6I99_02630 [Chloroflexi bacterium]|nr:MAG: hypothetical protein E6I99_02630 [Chloroflexota bacterium]TMD81760.1 MAG: hypothetical protein E6I74_11480 [Chloroflexota bacterium]
MKALDFMQRMVDFDRFMEGENRDSNDPDDIEHWCAVYGEMIRFKEGLLGETQREVEKVPDMRNELSGNDIPFLEAELRRLRRGLAFWEARRAERKKRR